MVTTAEVWWLDAYSLLHVSRPPCPDFIISSRCGFVEFVPHNIIVIALK